jgi:hypothetical protein
MKMPNICSKCGKPCLAVYRIVKRDICLDCYDENQKSAFCSYIRKSNKKACNLITLILLWLVASCSNPISNNTTVVDHIQEHTNISTWRQVETRVTDTVQTYSAIMSDSNYIKFIPGSLRMYTFTNGVLDSGWTLNYTLDSADNLRSPHLDTVYNRLHIVMYGDSLSLISDYGWRKIEYIFIPYGGVLPKKEWFSS